MHNLEVLTSMAGRLTLCFDLFGQSWGLHLLPKKTHRNSWGYTASWWNGPIYEFGLGPLALLVWHQIGLWE